MTLVGIMSDATAGDPISGLKWSRKSLRKVARALRRQHLRISAPTVSRVLKKDGYSLRVNAKRLVRSQSSDRERQFAYLVRQRHLFLARGWPVISVDSKKRELVGPFKNAGRSWRRLLRSVNMYDFPDDALGVAVLYGVYDVGRNEGYMSVGVAHDTPEFAVATIRAWWLQMGRRAYSQQRRLLIEADCGGSNGVHERQWKVRLQELADEMKLTITVTHYPTGASKWNPIEHRMFSAISTNWAGQPLDSYETILKYIRTTKTATGFKCRAHLDITPYRTGVKVSDERFARLHLVPRSVLPKWNYSLKPRPRSSENRHRDSKATPSATGHPQTC